MAPLDERKTWTVEEIREFFRSLRENSLLLKTVALQKKKDRDFPRELVEEGETGGGNSGKERIAMEESGQGKAIQGKPEESGPPVFRKLTKKEIDTLSRQGNYSSSWDRIYVHPDFTSDCIRGNRFEGNCIIGCLSGPDDWHRNPEGNKEVHGNKGLPRGICNSLIVDSEIGNNTALYNVVPLQGVVLKENCTIVDSSITGGRTEFGNDTVLTLGVEAGGRDLPVFAELVPGLLSSLLHCSKEDQRRRVYREEWERYRREIAYHRSLIMDGVSIHGTKDIRTVFLGPAVEINGAAGISDSTVCSLPEEPTVLGAGVQINNSIIQEGCRITTQALVDKALLFEHSHVERQGKVTQSVLSPNTGVGEGEVSSSYLGPFIGFHHQSMLIAAVWPEGKGNVGAGANIGSNHTSRAPDQELFPGEGMFFGIGCCIKYPGDYRKAPYTIVVTGTTTLPQKVEFPFSLITPPSKYYEISPVFNRLIPGWCIYNNMYFLIRNEEKYRKRNRSKRSQFPVEIFREEIIRNVLHGRHRLISIPERKVLYRIEDIPGLGKNFMLEEDRKAGIEAYDFVIDFHTLREVKRLLAAPKKELPSWLPSVPENRWQALGGLISGDLASENLPPEQLSTGEFSSRHPEIPLFVQLLIHRGWYHRGEKAVLEEYMKSLDIILEKSIYSKKKDDLRGERIQPDYFQVHHRAEEDPLIIGLQERITREKGEIKALLLQRERN